MRLTLVCVGKLKAGPERLLFERYFKRLTEGARGVGFASVDLREIDESRARRPDERRAEEGAAILAAVPKGGALVLLDERGPSTTSEEWAADIGRARDASLAAYAVAIGGPDGLDPSLRRRGPSNRELRLDDMAAPARPRDGRRTALSGDDHSRRPSLSSPMSAAILARFRDSCLRMSQSVTRIRRIGAAALALVAFLSAARGAPAEFPPPGPSEAADHERAEKEIELRGVEDTIRASEEQRRSIELEIESIRADRARLSAALIETTARVQDAERGAAAADDRMASLNATADDLSRSLERRRAMIADVLAALQRMGRDPPPAILVKPHDMSEAVRAATVLAAVIPELKSETEAVRHDIDALAKTRESIVRERDELTRRGAALALDKMRLAALIDARQQSLASAQDALGSQQQRAADLAKQATSLKDLLARLDSEFAARKAAEAAAACGRCRSGDGDRGAGGGCARRRSSASEARDRLRRRQGTGGAAGRWHDIEEFRIA